MADETGGLSHIDEQGRARMVDVGDKGVTERSAAAEARIWMRPATLEAIQRGDAPKGDVLSTARIAATMAAKRTSDTIPMCHPLRISSVAVSFEIPGAEDEQGRRCIRVEASVRADDRTGVEMEALYAASVAALTIYDMSKALEKGMEIGGLRLLSKRGGKSGDYELQESV